MTLKVKFRSLFPALVQANPPILLTKVGSSYTFGFDASQAPSGPAGATGATGATGAGYGGTSATSLLIANSVTKVFTTQAGLAYQAGNYVRASSASASGSFMEGTVSAYTGTSLSIAVTTIGGSGTFADWVFAIAGIPGTTGVSTINGNSGPFTTSTGVKTVVNDIQADATFHTGFIGGLVLSNDVSLPNTVLDIAAGVCVDSTNAVFIKLGAFTKTTAGTWTSGTGSTGMGTALTIANSTWYHVFAIINAGVADVYFDTSVTAANKPASTTAFRRVGSFKTNGSAQIIAFTQVGDEFHWAANSIDLSFTSISSTTASVMALGGVPTGVQVNALFHAGASLTSNGILFTSLDENDIAPESIGGSANASISNGSTTNFVSGDFNKRTNTSAQIRWRALAATGSLGIYTFGWIDARGK